MRLFIILPNNTISAKNSKKPRISTGSNSQRTWRRKRYLSLGSWNIQGIRTRDTEVFKELSTFNIDIAILGETKKKGEGNGKKGDYVHL